ncbi:hypothetical protein PGT21_001970 [Puccinia graminis f. sp. tritici]|uniref:DUF5745 domain-containing protein n=1 Tax=Puccinia graminis f. sp. tritici TaxID=56615 RepID=A0A5B0MWB7_PUCGR|nr:hypothetical protein PGTUg99_010105 [Puccinia graminis f. sp. tritici]KAA1103831.1 hypothetical protein PGT21_001970 [Puccinia graminis f. sp. tritici]
MRPQQYRQSSSQDKGKAREIDHTDVLSQLNKLMGSLLIPISIPELSVATPSLLLAVLESILERRFLALNDATRTSKSPHSRSKCLKVMIKVLSQILQVDVDRWSPDSIDLPGLVRGDMNEMVKLIDGLLKLSRKYNDSVRGTIPQGMSRQQLNEKRKSKESAFENQQHRSERAPTARNARPSQISSLHSNWSSLSIEPSQIPFDGLFSPVGPPLDQSSLKLPSSASSTTSSNGPLSRSLNSHRNNEDPLSGQISNPPTLRNLLGPLHAQMISSKRPHTPRTAHRVMVNKLRNEGAQEDTRDQNPNHDTDGSMPAKAEAEGNDDSSADESPYQYNKGLSLMTLDGIEPDDPFVSMETRRALESQTLQNQTNISFDLTQLAVAGSESFNKSSQSINKTQRRSYATDWKEGSELLNNTWSTSSSSAISNHSQNSYQLASNPDGSWCQSSQGDHHDYHQDYQSFTQSTRSSPRAGEQAKEHLFSFGGSVESNIGDDHMVDRTDCGFGRPTGSIKMRSRDHSLQIPYPTSIPLPASPTQSNFSSSDHCKIMLASQGAKLALVVSDVMAYEQQKHVELNIEGWDWMDLSKLAQESEKLEQLGSGSTAAIDDHQANMPTNLHARKLELLKLLAQAYNHNQSYDRTRHASDEGTITREEKAMTRSANEQTEKLRIRVSRQPMVADVTQHLARPANQLIVLNKSYHVRSSDLSSPAHHSRSRDFCLGYNEIDPDDLKCFDDRGDALLDDVI